jgi:Putative DNA-binding domain
VTWDELLQLVASVQQHQSAMGNVEVKAARGVTPQRLYEPLSAFANHTGGGVILFGLDEKSNFEVVGVGDTLQLQEDARRRQQPGRGTGSSIHAFLCRLPPGRFVDDAVGVGDLCGELAHLEDALADRPVRGCNLLQGEADLVARPEHDHWEVEPLTDDPDGLAQVGVVGDDGGHFVVPIERVEEQIRRDVDIGALLLGSMDLDVVGGGATTRTITSALRNLP